MKQKIIVIDNFYDNPWEIYQKAITAKYGNLDDEVNYPGRNTIECFYNEECHRKICEILGQKIIPSKETSVGHIRSTLKGQKGALSVHCDVFEDYAGIIYLTLPSQCEGVPGTSFYLHKKTGLDHFPNDAEVKMYGWQNPWELKQGFTTLESNSDDSWHKYCTIFMRYNRLILFDSKLWHSSEPGFGDCIENSRLVQLLFFKNE